MIRKASPHRFPKRPTIGQEFAEPDRLQAWRAVQTFNKMRPQLVHFARSVTGNPKVDIRVTAGVPVTSGNLIFIRPPLGLGRNPKHDRPNCGMRGNEGRQLCYACEVREVIDFFLFHEIAHVAFKTQVRPSSTDYAYAKQYLEEWHPSGVCNHAGRLAAEMYGVGDPKNLGHILNKFLGMLINCLEDTRVNQRMFDARPGLKSVFDLNVERIMTEGNEIGVETYISWSEAPLDSQFMIGLFLQSSGHALEGRLHPAVIEALADQQIVDLCNEAAQARSAHEIFALSLEVFRRAQNLGFCIVEKCVPTPPVPPQPGDSSDEKGKEGGSESGEGSPGSEAGDGAPDSDGSQGSNDGPEAESSGQSGSSGLGDGTSADSAERETSAGGKGSDFDDQSADVSPDEPKSTADGGPDSEKSEDNPPTDESDRDGDDGPGDSGTKDNKSSLGKESDEAGTDSEGADENYKKSDEPDDNGGSDSDLDQKPGGDLDDGSDPDSRDGDKDTEGESDQEGLEGDPAKEDDLPGPEGDQLEHARDLAENPWDTEGSQPEPPFDAPTGDAPDTMARAPEHGTDDDAARALARFLMHGLPESDGGFLDDMAGDQSLGEILGQSGDEDDHLSEEARELLKVAILQVAYFDDASRYVAGVETVQYPNRSIGWGTIYNWTEFDSPEGLVGKTVLHGRLVFDANERGKHLRNLRSGRVNTRKLALRAPVGDDRLFHKKSLPGKRSYFVVIGVDCSGSTSLHRRNEKIKRAVMAQAEVLTRLGVPWAGYGHTAYTQPLANFDLRGNPQADSYYVYILPFKQAEESWNNDTKTRLANIMPVSDNLDGHTLEYYRKVVEKSQATDKIIIYYTDGEMPAANYTEEREVLEREVETCKRKGITLLGVGINTDSPSYYGMDTVRIDGDEDIQLVMQQLDQRLTKER